MKIFKKVLSVFLSAVIMVGTLCAGTVSAGAEVKSKPTVIAYDNEDGNGITILVSGLAAADIDSAFSGINNHGYTFCAGINLNEAMGKTCFIEYLKNQQNSGYRFVYEGDDIKSDTIPVSVTAFLPNTEKNCYDIMFTLQKDHKICDEIKKAIKSDKEIRVDAQLLTPEGIVLTMDLEFGENFCFFTDPEWTDSDEKNTKSISTLTFSEISKKTYTGENRKASVTIKDGDYTLVKGTDYTLTYKNCKNIGTASVTIKGKGKYTGTKTLTYKIVPKKTTLAADKKSSSKVKLSWTAVDGAEKYQIYYSADGGNSYKKLATVSGDKTSCTVKKLDFENNDYKFKIRSYKKVDGTKYYSSFSKVVTVK